MPSNQKQQKDQITRILILLLAWQTQCQYTIPLDFPLSHISHRQSPYTQLQSCDLRINPQRVTLKRRSRGIWYLLTDTDSKLFRAEVKLQTTSVESHRGQGVCEVNLDQHSYLRYPAAEGAIWCLYCFALSRFSYGVNDRTKLDRGYVGCTFSVIEPMLISPMALSTSGLDCRTPSKGPSIRSKSPQYHAMGERWMEPSSQCSLIDEHGTLLCEKGDVNAVL